MTAAEPRHLVGHVQNSLGHGRADQRQIQGSRPLPQGLEHMPLFQEAKLQGQAQLIQHHQIQPTRRKLLAGYCPDSVDGLVMLWGDGGGIHQAAVNGWTDPLQAATEPCCLFRALIDATTQELGNHDLTPLACQPDRLAQHVVTGAPEGGNRHLKEAVSPGKAVGSSVVAHRQIQTETAIEGVAPRSRSIVAQGRVDHAGKA